VKIRVLLVDDEKEFAEALAERLAFRGLIVRISLSGADALEKLQHEESDVVVLDLSMPGMSGTETLRLIKQIKPAVQVIMLTGHATIQSGMDALKLGAYTYLLKPTEINDLISQINKAHAERQPLETRGSSTWSKF